MLKQLGILLVLTVLAVLFIHPLSSAVQGLLHAQAWVDAQLATIFNAGQVGHIIRRTLAISVIPVVATFVPALLYRVFLQKSMPYQSCVLWGFWLIVVSALAAL